MRDSGRVARDSSRVAALVLTLVVGYAVCAPLLAAAAEGPDFAAARLAPSLAHWFGTDYAGQDLFVRVALGLRISLLIAVVCAVSSTLVGLAVGTLAAVFGGWADAALMRATDAVNALPHLLLGIVIVALFRGSVTAIVVSITLTHWPQVARIVRAEALTARELEYVEAAYLAGASRAHVLLRHLLPAAIGQALVAVVLLLPHAIWHESTLSFLGLGLSPDRPSLGTLLQQSRGEILLGGWWTLAFPAGLLVLTTLGVAGLAGSLQRRWAPEPESVVAGAGSMSQVLR
ncbi:MAG: ABC transporter permease [Micrococcales bacterium]|nr:ABC transporter permease [Micrococcales bacterium]